MLDAFTEEAVRRVSSPVPTAGGGCRKKLWPDPQDRHTDEVLLLGDAGTCVIFNSHSWHGGTTNRSKAPRRALHGAFVRREHRQQTVQQMPEPRYPQPAHDRAALPSRRLEHLE